MNFKELDDLINSGVKEIALSEDVFLVSGEGEKYYPSGIEINTDGLVIDGNGHTIDAEKSAKIFHIEADNVTIKNLNFKNALVAILNEGKNLSLKNCRFNDNLGGSGGAIYSASDMNLEDCLFENNTADLSHGGAIYLYLSNDNPRQDVVFKNCIFKSNHINNRFSYKDYDGGAIFNGNANLFLFNCSFEDNGKVNDGYSKEGVSDSIYNGKEGFISLNNCYFKTDRKYCIRNDGHLMIRSSEFYHDFDSGYEIKGSILNFGSVGLLSSKCDQYDIRLNGKILNGSDIPNLIFTLEHMQGSNESFVCPIYDFELDNYESDRYLEGLIENNIGEISHECQKSGEYEFNFNYQKELILDSNILYSCNRTEAIELDEDNLIFDGNGHIINGNFQQIFNVVGDNICFKNVTFRNASHYKGSVMDLKGKNIQFIDCVFERNFAHLGVLNLDNSSVRLINCKFANNFSDDFKYFCLREGKRYSRIPMYYRKYIHFLLREGGIILSTNESSLIIENSQFIENHSKKSLINNIGSSLILKNSQIENNILKDDLISDNSFYNKENHDFQFHPVIIYNSNFNENSSGSLDCRHSFLLIKDSNFFDNESLNLKNISDFHYLENVKTSNHAESSVMEFKDENTSDFTYLNNLISRTVFQGFESFFENDDFEKLNQMEIYLDRDIKQRGSEGSIEIRFNNLVIDGQGHSISSSSGDMFIVNAKNIIFKNINFNRKSSSAIRKYNDSPQSDNSFKCINCTFVEDECIDEEGSEEEAIGGLGDLFR